MSSRWVFMVIFFLFLFFQEMDRHILRLITPEMTGLYFGDRLSFFNMLSWSTIVALFFFLIWGFLFDLHQRRKLFTLVGIIWGMTSWLMGVAPTFNTFNISRAMGGIDNASHSGIYSLLGDFFKPNNRGKMLGLLLLSHPLALFFGIFSIPALMLAVNWRILIFFFGGIGILFGLASFIFIHGPKRGNKEPALMDIEVKGLYLFDWENAKSHLKEKSMIIIYLLGFFSIIPWTAMTAWAADYFNSTSINPDVSINFQYYVLPSLITLAISFPLAGYLGDYFFQKIRAGRVFVCITGTALAMISLIFVYYFRDTSSWLLFTSLILLGIFFSFSWPNLIASILDITLPELRASAGGVFLLSQTIGAVVTPLFVNLFRRRIGLIGSTTWVCVLAWGICMVLFSLLFKRIPDDIERLRKHMAYRSYLEMRLKLPQNQSRN
jgi:MFS family permease